MSKFSPISKSLGLFLLCCAFGGYLSFGLPEGGCGPVETTPRSGMGEVTEKTALSANRSPGEECPTELTSEFFSKDFIQRLPAIRQTAAVKLKSSMLAFKEEKENGREEDEHAAAWHCLPASAEEYEVPIVFHDIYNRDEPEDEGSICPDDGTMVAAIAVEDFSAGQTISGKEICRYKAFEALHYLNQQFAVAKIKFVLAPEVQDVGILNTYENPRIGPPCQSDAECIPDDSWAEDGECKTGNCEFVLKRFLRYGSALTRQYSVPNVLNVRLAARWFKNIDLNCPQETSCQSDSDCCVNDMCRCCLNENGVDNMPEGMDSAWWEEWCVPAHANADAYESICGQYSGPNYACSDGICGPECEFCDLCDEPGQWCDEDNQRCFETSGSLGASWGGGEVFTKQVSFFSRRTGTLAPSLFHTPAHELGHALGLAHVFSNNHEETVIALEEDYRSCLEGGECHCAQAGDGICDTVVSRSSSRGERFGQPEADHYPDDERNYCVYIGPEGGNFAWPSAADQDNPTAFAESLLVLAHAEDDVNLGEDCDYITERCDGDCCDAAGGTCGESDGDCSLYNCSEWRGACGQEVGTMGKDDCTGDGLCCTEDSAAGGCRLGSLSVCLIPHPDEPDNPASCLYRIPTLPDVTNFLDYSAEPCRNRGWDPDDLALGIPTGGPTINAAHLAVFGEDNLAGFSCHQVHVMREVWAMGIFGSAPEPDSAEQCLLPEISGDCGTSLVNMDFNFCAGLAGESNMDYCEACFAGDMDNCPLMPDATAFAHCYRDGLFDCDGNCFRVMPPNLEDNIAEHVDCDESTGYCCDDEDCENPEHRTIIVCADESCTPQNNDEEDEHSASPGPGNGVCDMGENNAPNLACERWGWDGGDCLLGCTDRAACNYDADVDVDDGSCTYADQYYDCDGNCIGDDSDGDGVCDALEVDGCTDTNACNYDSNASEDDGSCTYVEDEQCCASSQSGDINVDGLINILDIVLVATAILNDSSLPHWPCGDMDGNNVLNILDIVQVVNEILSSD